MLCSHSVAFTAEGDFLLKSLPYILAEHVALLSLYVVEMRGFRWSKTVELIEYEIQLKLLVFTTETQRTQRSLLIATKNTRRHEKEKRKGI